MSYEYRLRQAIRAGLEQQSFAYRGRIYVARVSQIRHYVGAPLCSVLLAFGSCRVEAEIDIQRVILDDKHLRRRALVALRRAVDGEC